MGIIEMIAIGIGLSMDASAVAMTNGMVYKETSGLKKWCMPILFGLFQGLMPLLGFYMGGIFADIITQYSGWAILIILGYIGIDMIRSGLSHKECECIPEEIMYKTIFIQAITTSIDAFAVGIAFTAVSVNIFLAVSLITITTFICSFIAILIGERFGDLLGCKAEILGGIILLIIAIKAIL